MADFPIGSKWKQPKCPVVVEMVMYLLAKIKYGISSYLFPDSYQKASSLFSFQDGEYTLLVLGIAFLSLALENKCYKNSSLWLFLSYSVPSGRILESSAVLGYERWDIIYSHTDSSSLDRYK